MITRLVKLSLDPGSIDDFLKLFGSVQKEIADFPGCRGVKLLRDSMETNVYFTYSIWESDSDLGNYRHSELFKATWKQAKKCFSAPAQAWSLIQSDIIL
jgi:(4S)-4-hydroxy-5-phosphonooxypentane-2,3-dione isomerase